MMWSFDYEKVHSPDTVAVFGLNAKNAATTSTLEARLTWREPLLDGHLFWSLGPNLVDIGFKWRLALWGLKDFPDR